MKIVFKSILLIASVELFIIASFFIENKIISEYLISFSEDEPQRAQSLAGLFTLQNLPKEFIDRIFSTHLVNHTHQKQIGDISSRFALLTYTQKDRLTDRDILSSAIPEDQKDKLTELLTNELLKSQQRQKDAARKQIISEEQKLLSSLLSLSSDSNPSSSLYENGVLRGLPSLEAIPDSILTLEDLYGFFKQNGLPLQTFSTYSKTQLSSELESMSTRIQKKLSELEDFNFNERLDEKSKIKLTNEIKNIYNSDG